jgi:MinD-like ATPase involved in chromosome partitioning or flagellar assembly
MYYGKKAALQLKRQRISLQKQHKGILAVLNKASGETPSEDVTQRVQNLRIAFRAAAIDSILVSQTITKKMLVLNFGGIIDAHMANKRINIVINDILKTLTSSTRKNLAGSF